MQVKLINKPTLDYTDWAIGECYNKGTYADTEKRDNRIKKVALKHKHTSVLEFYSIIVKITTKTPTMLNLKLQSFNNMYIDIHKLNSKEALVKINGRTLFEIPLPKFIYDVVPEEHRFIIGYKPIPGYDYYVMNKDADIFKVEKGNTRDSYELPKKLNPDLTSDGYLAIRLASKSGNRKYRGIHRWLMLTFDGKNEMEHINHKDGNKLNNSLDNLEWCTASHNEKHSYEILGKTVHNKGVVRGNSHVAKPIEQLDMNGNHIAYFDCGLDAIETLSKQGIKLSSGALSDTLNGKHKQYKGFKWKFV